MTSQTTKTNQKPADYVLDPITCEELEARQLSGGASSWIELLPCKTRVRKAVQPWVKDYYRRTAMITDMRNERDIYNHLPKGHPRFLEMLASYDTGIDVGIDLPYLPNGTLRTYLQTHHIDDLPDGTPFIPARQRACWAVEMMDGIRFLHEHDVIHCDIKPHNMLLDDALGIRIIDMAGSGLGGRPGSCCESIRFYMPRPRNGHGTVTTDLFAAGMTLFEIVTGAQPYGEMSDLPALVALYKRGEFPSVAALTLPPGSSEPPPRKFITKFASFDPEEVGNTGSARANTSPMARARAPTDAGGREILFAGVMQRCWHGQFASAQDVLEALAEDIRATFCDKDVVYIEKVAGLSLQAGTVGARRRESDVQGEKDKDGEA